MPGDSNGFIKSLGIARLVIIAFLALLLIIAWVKGLPLETLISNSLTRAGMNGILVLAMVPSVQAGLGLNFGLPVGIICGLLGLVLAFEWSLGGMAGFFVAAGLGCLFALGAGYLYGCVLNRVKGQEMMVGTYAGFSVVAAMCMFWVMAPFTNPRMIFVVGGKGLRVTMAMDDELARVLDNLVRINIGRVEVPVSLLGFFALACLFVWVFSRTPWGIAMRVAGGNPAYAAACGINCETTRMTGSIVSTVLAAIGIVVYAQSFGFIQLYTAPLMMAFPAVASILIGGANTRQATVLHAVTGVFLFQTLLTVSLPVTQTLIEGDMSEVARMIISNGMILYALTRGRNGA
ncbi:MAG: ABC transporter permease subunit [Ignavibacteriales bacterium]